MKSMEEYINEVYQKYEETEKNNIKYKTVKVKYHSPLKKLCGIAACVAVVLTVCIGVKYFKIDNNEEIKYVSGEKKEGNPIVYTQYLHVDASFFNSLNIAVDSKECIAIVSKAEITNHDFEFINRNFFLKSIGNIQVDKDLKNNICKNNIKFSKYCGKVSLEELEQNEYENWEKWELDNLGKVIPESEKEYTYFEQLPTKGTDFEEGKQYLVFMDYNEEEDIYEITSLAYGIMEYDPNTNMVKNIETGEFVEIDWSLIEQN